MAAGQRMCYTTVFFLLMTDLNEYSYGKKYQEKYAKVHLIIFPSDFITLHLDSVLRVQLMHKFRRA